jgi:polyisoprenyl-teichoic acid--peptidoglycan teichoic acid transferase
MKNHTFSKTGVIISWIFIFLVGFFVVKGLLFALRFMRTTGVTPSLLASLVVDDGVVLKSSNDRTNILILGVGGGTHEGADLTDTMMVVSLNVSIPRDIWSETLKDRVNSAYHYGEEKKKGGGLLLSKVVAEDVVGLPIHYSFLLDFSGFKEIIDMLGGIEVNVSKAFTDEDYPIAGKEKDSCPGDPTNRCVYETIHFDVGMQHMDGERALKYVRSRHAEGEEGSDFARGRRQQDVLVALKDTLVHPTKWVTPDRIRQLQAIFDRATDSDMNLGEMATVAKRVGSVKDEDIQKVSFDTLLYNPPTYLYGRYVLIPVRDWEEIHTFIKQKLGFPSLGE